MRAVCLRKEETFILPDEFHLHVYIYILYTLETRHCYQGRMCRSCKSIPFQSEPVLTSIALFEATRLFCVT